MLEEVLVGMLTIPGYLCLSGLRLRGRREPRPTFGPIAFRALLCWCLMDKNFVAEYFSEANILSFQNNWQRLAMTIS